MAKPNKDGWIRHRGGVPKGVTVGQLIRYRDRDGDTGFIRIDHFSLTKNSVCFAHYGKNHWLGDSDIMAYKLLED